MDLIKLLSEGDARCMEMENARHEMEAAKAALEKAKERLELAKSDFEQLLAQSDEAGIPKAKFKKVIEERTAALWNSGLISSAINEKVTKLPKAPKSAKPPRKAKSEVDDVTTEFEDNASVYDAPIYEEAVVTN